jgi:hypothetical protein
MGRRVDRSHRVVTAAVATSGAAVVLLGAIVLRWLGRLQRRVNDHAERIARIEGRLLDPPV